MKTHLTCFLLLSVLTLNCDAGGIIDGSYSLSKCVKPIRYTLTMEPDMNIHNDSSTFKGSVIIELKTLQATNNITLHARDLNINKDFIEIIGSDENKIGVLNTTADEDREFYTMHLEKELVQDEYYNLTLDFSGPLSYDNVGFYLAKYNTSEGQERILAVTDFEPSDARKAFPCFDEPSMKAKFAIKIIRPDNYSSISNEELVSTENLGNGRYQDTFKETVIMPPYVVAFLVFDYKHTERRERQRIFARPEAIDAGKLDFALSVAVETLQVLEEFTGINYTSAKMDQVAIPDKYFHDEAMENWGLVTFSEKHLFISNETSTAEDFQRCATYIAHEFSHQWFGNLVTFKEWKYIWLSEGFGAYFQYYIASLVKPSWRLMDQFVLLTLHRVLDYDASDETEPMNYQPKHIGAIPNAWISYYKASSVIRMAEHFLSNSIFKKGLNIYLEKNKYGVAEPSDLYQAFQEAVDEEGAYELLGNHSMLSIMRTWDSNVGFPLVTVIRDYETGATTISQKRHFENDKGESDSLWYVPVSYAFELDDNTNFSDTTANLWLTEKSVIINDNFSTDGWLIINKQQTGFYRINYDVTNWNRLAAFLNSENYDSIHVVNRAQLFFDSFYFAQYGKIPYEVPLNLSKYLVRETDYIALAPFLDSLQYLNRMMASSKMYDVFQNYVINLLSTVYDHLGFDEKPDDTHLDRLNRFGVLKWLCNLGHSECRNSALQKVREWKNTGKFAVSKNLELVVLCAAMRNAPMEDWEFLYSKLFTETNSRNQKKFTTSILGCSEDPIILNNFLDKLTNSSNLFKYEGRLSFRAITTSRAGLNVAFEYLKNHPDLPKRTQDMFACDLGQKFTTEEQLNELKQLSSIRREEFRCGFAFTQENLEWINKGYTKQIEEWLLEYNKESIESANVV